MLSNYKMIINAINKSSMLIYTSTLVFAFDFNFCDYSVLWIRLLLNIIYFLFLFLFLFCNLLIQFGNIENHFNWNVVWPNRLHIYNGALNCPIVEHFLVYHKKVKPFPTIPLPRVVISKVCVALFSSIRVKLAVCVHKVTVQQFLKGLGAQLIAKVKLLAISV